MGISITLNKRSGTNSPYNPTLVDENWTTIETAFASVPSAALGTVTSVGLSTTQTSLLTIASSPVISSGVITINFATQTANKVFAGPTSGSAATPTFRSLVAADIGFTIPTTSGGTGKNTIGSSYQLLRTNTGATGLEYFTLQAGSNKITVTPGAGVVNIDVVPTNIAITDLTGVLAISHGGTGSSTAQTARLALLPATNFLAGRVLTVNGGATDVIWSTPSGGIASINGDATAAQTIVIGSAGTDFAITTTGGVTTVNIPSASSLNRGLVTIDPQNFAGVKTFSSNPVITPSTSTAIFWSRSGELFNDAGFTRDITNTSITVEEVNENKVTTVVGTTTTALTLAMMYIRSEQTGNIIYTLPDISLTPSGKKYRIKDSLGGCASKKITVSVNGGDYIENQVGKSAIFQTTAYSFVEVTCVYSDTLAHNVWELTGSIGVYTIG